VYAGPKTVIVPFLTARVLQEVTAMRLALEGLAAERALPQCDEYVLNELHGIQDRINHALSDNDYHASLHHNKEFHFAIYRRSEMPHLIATIESLWLRIGPSFHHLYPEFARTRYGVHNHMSAIEAIRDNDGPALRAAIENDIRDGFRRLKGALREPEQK
jgi:DNA-binding GntR family transcriptional regulator